LPKQTRICPAGSGLSLPSRPSLYAVLNLHLLAKVGAGERFDDALFFRHAISILQGHWLGPYSNLTLTKGPGYPLFLAANSIIGLPITLMQSLLYAAACTIMASTLYQMCGRISVALVTFLILEWHPAILEYRTIIRDDISAAQVLLILSCCCRFLFLETSLQRRLAWAITGGLMLGWAWITREDSGWILPGLFVMFGLHLLRLRNENRAMAAISGSIAAFGASSLAVVGTIAAVNLAVYGTFLEVDFKSPSFLKALTVLQSVRVGDPVPHVPVPDKVRQAVYKVSPAFASLEPYFDGPGKVWTGAGCEEMPSTCGDFAGGLFEFALRDATASRGYYATPASAADFYDRLWREVHQACRSGQLTCRQSLIPFLPAMRRDQWQDLPGKIVSMAQLATLHRVPPLQELSTGTPLQMDQAMLLLRSPMRTITATESGTITATGWYKGQPGTWIGIRCNTPYGEIHTAISHLPSPDLVMFFHQPSLNAQRFAVAVPASQDCGLETIGGTPFYVAVSKLNPYYAFGGSILNFDLLETSSPPDAGRGGFNILVRLNAIYRHILPVMSIVGIIAYLAFSVRMLFRWRLDDLRPLFILTSGVWILVLTRATILILVAISSFPAITQQYFLPAYPLICLAVIASLALPFDRREKVSVG
jgi:hypothetical protein